MRIHPTPFKNAPKATKAFTAPGGGEQPRDDHGRWTRKNFGSTRALGKAAYVPAADKGFHHIINAPAQAKKAAAMRYYGSTEWRRSHPEWKEPFRKVSLP